VSALLERVRFMGGNGGSDVPAAEPDPEIGGPATGYELDPDPEPGTETTSKRTARKSAASSATAAGQKRAGGKFVSTAKMQKDMADELNSYAKMLALTWSMSDETCAGVLNETSAAITRDLAALLARSDWVMERFQTTSLIGDMLKFLHSSWPLIRAMIAHHGPSRTREEGEPDAVTEPITVVDPNAYGAWRPPAY